jgi:hypothetical protein
VAKLSGSVGSLYLILVVSVDSGGGNDPGEAVMKVQIAEMMVELATNVVNRLRAEAAKGACVRG